MSGRAAELAADCGTGRRPELLTPADPNPPREPLDQQRRVSPLRPLTEIHHSRSHKTSARLSGAAKKKAKKPKSGRHDSDREARSSAIKSDRQNVAMVNPPKEALVALLTQAAPEYESATPGPLTRNRTGSSLFPCSAHPTKAPIAIPDATG